jgi:hypothetical protein
MLTMIIQRLPLRSMRHAKCIRRPIRVAMVSLFSVSCAMLAMMTTGCGNSVSQARAGTIAVVDASGTATKVSVLAVGSPLKVSMMPSGDKANAGIDWVVNCSGNPVTGSVTNGACGTFSPTHSADGAMTV